MPLYREITFSCSEEHFCQNFCYYYNSNIPRSVVGGCDGECKITFQDETGKVISKNDIMELFGDPYEEQRKFRMIFDLKRRTSHKLSIIRIIDSDIFDLEFLVRVEMTFENLPKGYIDISFYQVDDRIKEGFSFVFRFDTSSMNYQEWKYLYHLRNRNDYLLSKTFIDLFSAEFSLDREIEESHLFLRGHGENFLYTYFREFEGMVMEEIEEIEIKFLRKTNLHIETFSDYIIGNKLILRAEKYSAQIRKCKISQDQFIQERDHLNKKIEILDEIIPTLEAECEENENALNDGIQKLMVKTVEDKDTNISHDDSDTKCSICLEAYDQDERRRSCITVCGHQFCSICISKFSGSCPKCRKSFKKPNILKLF